MMGRFAAKNTYRRWRVVQQQSPDPPIRSEKTNVTSFIDLKAYSLIFGGEERLQMRGTTRGDE